MSTLTLTDAKAYLNITESSTDAELQVFIDAAESSIARQCGPLASTACTKRARGGKCALVVPVTPLLTVSSVVPVNGAALDVTKLNVDPAGVIEYLTGGTFGYPFYDVTYTAGRATVPADLLQGVKEHTAHLWKTQQGGTRRPGSTDTAAIAGAASLFTWRVEALIAPYVQGGFA